MSTPDWESPANGETDIKVLLADDEEMSRRGFAAALKESHGISLVASTGLGARLNSSIRTARPDVVVLNSATEGDWVDVVRRIVTDQIRQQPPRVIVVTGADIADLLRAVHAGATGILLRNVSVEELSYAVRHVAAGHCVISPVATSYMLARLRSLADTGGGHGPGIAGIGLLSRREREILAGLAAGRSNREIATYTQLTVATVKSHVSRILTKLDVRDRVQAALLGQQAGVGVEFGFNPAAADRRRDRPARPARHRSR